MPRRRAASTKPASGRYTDPVADRRRARRILLGALLLVCGAGATSLWLGSEQMLRPVGYGYPRPTATDPMQAFGLPYEEVAFPTAGAAVLRGWWLPGAEGAAAVVGVHGAGANRSHLLEVAPFLHRAGHPVLLFDLREHGTSDGAGRGLGFGPRESRDVSAAVAFARSRGGAERVAVLGSSLGATAVLLAAARDPAIDAVIAENPWARIEHVMRSAPQRPRFVPDAFLTAIRATAYWRVGALGAPEPLDVVDRIAPRPLLLLHGTEDRMIPPAESELLFAAAGQPVELWIAPGAGHSALYDTDPAAFRARVLGFLERWLGPPSETASGAGGDASP